MLHYLQLASEGGFDVLGPMREDPVMAPYRKDVRVQTLVQNARLLRNGRISVADAHLGAVIQSATVDRITVVTSDPGDMRLAAGDKDITVVRL